MGGFDGWFECFRILFDVSSVSLMEEFQNLKALIVIEVGETDTFTMKDESLKTVTWINGVFPNELRKRKHFISNILFPNILTRARRLTLGSP